MPQVALTDADYKMINRVLHEKFNISHATLQVEKGSEADSCKRSEVC
jgi:hypothetical protein